MADIEKQIRSQLDYHRGEVDKLSAILAILDNGKSGHDRTDRAEQYPTVPGLDLNNLPVSVAIVEYLKHQASNGVTEVPLGELEKAIRAYRLTTARGTPRPIAKNHWKALIHVLRSSWNRDKWELSRQEGNMLRADTIRLKPGFQK